MKVHATQYAAICALIGMASQLNEAHAMPTSPTTLEQPFEKRAPAGLKDWFKKGSKSSKTTQESKMEDPLIEKNLETSSEMPLTKELKKSKTKKIKMTKEEKQKAKEEKRLSSLQQKPLNDVDGMALAHQYQMPRFMTAPGII